MPVRIPDSLANFEGPKEVSKGWYGVRIADARVVDTRRGPSIAIEELIIDQPASLDENFVGTKFTDFLTVDVSRVDERFRDREINKIYSLARAANLDLSTGEFDEQQLIGLEVDAFLTPSKTQDGVPSARVSNYDEAGSQTQESDL